MVSSALHRVDAETDHVRPRARAFLNFNRPEAQARSGHLQTPKQPQGRFVTKKHVSVSFLETKPPPGSEQVDLISWTKLARPAGAGTFAVKIEDHLHDSAFRVGVEWRVVTKGSLRDPELDFVTRTKREVSKRLSLKADFAEPGRELADILYARRAGEMWFDEVGQLGGNFWHDLSLDGGGWPLEGNRDVRGQDTVNVPFIVA